MSEEIKTNGMGEDIMAIVSSGCRKLICKIWEHASPGNVYNLKECYELRSDMLLMPTQHGLALNYKTTVVPVDIDEDPVDILAMVDNIRFFRDMKDSGIKYTNMIAEYEDNMIKNRAGRAGLEVARNVPGGDPKKKLIL